MNAPKLTAILDQGVQGFINKLEQVILLRMTVIAADSGVSNLAELVATIQNENDELKQSLGQLRSQVASLTRDVPSEYNYLHKCYPGLSIGYAPSNYEGAEPAPATIDVAVIINSTLEPLVMDKVLRIQQAFVTNRVKFEYWGEAASRFLGDSLLNTYLQISSPTWKDFVDTVYCEPLLRQYNWQRLIQWDSMWPRSQQLVIQYFKQLFNLCEQLREPGHLEHQKLRVALVLLTYFADRIADVVFEDITTLSELQAMVLGRFNVHDKFPGEVSTLKKSIHKYVKVAENEDGLAVYRKDSMGLSAKPSMASIKLMSLLGTLHVDIHGSPTRIRNPVSF